MKKYILSLVLSSLTMALSAMNYNEAREQARFLTDKMAYELNLNEQQYNDCYEINLDYLMSVTTADDVYGDYLSYRNADIRHILYDWQFSLFAAADYFLRPLAWYHGAFIFPIYRHYTPGHYYYAHPVVFNTYHGGHGRFYHRAGFYASRRPHWNGGFRGNDRVHHRGQVAHHVSAPHGAPRHQGGYHFEVSRPQHHGGSFGGNHGGNFGGNHGGNHGTPNHGGNIGSHQRGGSFGNSNHGGGFGNSNHSGGSFGNSNRGGSHNQGSVGHQGRGSRGGFSGQSRGGFSGQSRGVRRL